MANILKMAKIHAIIGLLENKWTYRRIARELGVDRETVARYDRLRRNRESKPAIVAPGSGYPDMSNPAISTAGSERSLFADLFFPASGRSPGRPSECEPLREVIKDKLEQGLSAQRIFQDVTSEHGFTGSYSSVKRFVQRLDASTPLPFRRMEPEPGTEIQVDFGSGAWIIEGGKEAPIPRASRNAFPFPQELF